MQDYRSDVFYLSEACTDPTHAFCRVWTPCTWDGPLAPGKHLTTAEQLCNLKLSNWKEIPLLPPEPVHLEWVPSVRGEDLIVSPAMAERLRQVQE